MVTPLCVFGVMNNYAFMSCFAAWTCNPVQPSIKNGRNHYVDNDKDDGSIMNKIVLTFRGAYDTSASKRLSYGPYRIP